MKAESSLLLFVISKYRQQLLLYSVCVCVCINRGLTLQLFLLKVSVEGGAGLPLVQHRLLIVALQKVAERE